MKKFYLLIILSIFFIPSVVFAADYKVPKVDTSQKVYDYANKLSEEQEYDLYQRSIDYLETYKYELIFITIDQNPYGHTDRDIALYAEDFAEYNELNNSLIIMIDFDNRAPVVVATGKPILIYDDARREKMNDNAYNYLTSEDYYGAFKQYANDAVVYAKAGTSSSNENYDIDENGRYYKNVPKSVNWVISVLVGLGLSLIILFIHLRKYKGIRLATNANQYLKTCTDGAKVDQFLTTFTSKIKRSHDSGGSGGGGGSSISFGSGGGSHSSSVGRHF